jgi:uncharacterized cofD-like protein
LFRKPFTFLKWLIPGIGVKRWLGLFFLGVTLLGLAVAMLLIDFYRTQPPESLLIQLTLGHLNLWARALLVLLAGGAMVGLAFLRINRSILEPLSVDDDALIDAMLEHSRARRGPRIVAIGGGTGLPTLLRGLKQHTANLTAIITVADDGGSSGKLRRDLGVLPPGDFRNNIAALARDEGLMTRLFQYRFGEGGLEGHSFGNLFITAMSAVTGSFEKALTESSRVLAIRGEVLPSTVSDVTLMADMAASSSAGRHRVSGESTIPESEGRITRVFLKPEGVPAYPPAVRAILAAEVIILGPGSLFTSILPNLLIEDITQSIRASRALKIYVCNVATQHGETDGFSISDHVRVIREHVGDDLIDIVLTNNHFPALTPDANYEYVQPSKNGSGSTLPLYRSNLIDLNNPWRHDSEKLAQSIMNLINKPTGATADVLD